MATIENGTLPSVIPHSARTGVEMANAHGIAEKTDDFDTIMSTVSSWDSHFAIATAMPDGSTSLMTAFTPEQVTEHYRERVANVLADAGELRYCDVPGRWYDFMDAQYSVTMVPTGEVYTFRGAFLFPAWTDGIIGEIVYNVDPAQADVFELDAPIELAANLDALDDAWRSGDVGARLNNFDDTVTCAFGIAEVNGPGRHHVTARTKDELGRLLSAPEFGKVLQLERLQQLISTFYVFASYRLLVETGDGIVERETASIYLVGPGRRFVGELGYSMQTRL